MNEPILNERDNLRKEVGKRIELFRSNLNIKQEELAKMVGIAQNSLSQQESGKREPDLLTLVKLCECLNTRADILLGLDYNDPVASMTAEQMDQVLIFQDIYKDLNDEGRQLLKDLVRFVYSKQRYRRDPEKEERDAEREFNELTKDEYET